RFDGDIRPSAHRDSNISLHESRRVVDTVTDHRHAALGLKPSHDVCFVLWQYARVNLVDTHFATDLPRCAFVIACDEDGFETGVAQGGDGLDGIRSEPVPQRNKAQRTSIPRDNDHGAPRFLKCLDAQVKASDVNAAVSKETRVPDEQLMATNECHNTLSR